MSDSFILTLKEIFALIFAYIVGSIPTALIVARHLKGEDIRRVGDGNMGAQNVSHVVGTKYGILVGILDMGKGSLSILVGMALGLSTGWLMVCGIFAILGHDFPIFARFKGGQGTATTVGTYLVFFPLNTTVSLVVYGLLYAIIKRHTLSASIAGGLLLLQLIFIRKPWYLLVYVLALFIIIPIKKAADLHRVKEIAARHQEELLHQKAHSKKI
jgi:glycerol-3-phosphate acyltransferase PlsY